MRLERHPIRVRPETIYRFAFSKDGCDEQFYRHLPNTEDVIGHVVPAGTTGPKSSTYKDWLTGLNESLNTPSSATGNAI